MDNVTSLDLNTLEHKARKVKNHVLKHQERYAAGAAGLVVGLLVAKGFKPKPPTVDKAQIVFDWMFETTQKTGKSIYALNTAQRDTWEAIHKYAEYTAQRSGTAIDVVLKDIAADYDSYINYIR